MASQSRRRVFSNDNTSHRSNCSNRSTSPPDLLKVADFHDSAGSLDLNGVVGMDGSYNGTPTHSWTSNNNNKVVRRNSGDDLLMRRQLHVLPRHHSSDVHSSPRPNPPHHTLSGESRGARQRANLSPFVRRSPKRNLTGDFDVLGSTSPEGQPYGMLNPGPNFNLKGKKLSPLSPSHTWNPLYWFHRLSHTHHSHHSHHASHNKQLIALFGFCTLALLGIAVYQHDAMLQDALQLKEQEVDHHILHAKELEKRLQAIRQHSLELEDKLDKSEGEPHIDLETQRKLFHLEHNQLKMQQDVQQMSKRLIKEKYGHGPRFYVQMKLEFDPQSNVYKDEHDGDEVIIETASINDMPHSVYLFLEQVDHHLYDHSSFHRNAAHLVQAGPSVHPNAHAHFRHHPSLQSVVFQEYAPEMAHKQYTLGYPGRPGGPDFYINMRDNSAIHGPGGQHHSYSDIILDADPCFAKIVKGWNAIERVHRTQTEGDVILQPVTIVNMKVLPADYMVTHSDSNSDSEDF